MVDVGTWRRAVWTSAGALALAGALVAEAAGPAPQLEDPRGDWATAQADIVSVTLTTLKDRKGVSKALVVTMRLAAPPDSSTPVIYSATMRHGECGAVSVRLLVAGDSGGVRQEGDVRRTQCDSGTVESPVQAALTGDRIVWQVPLDSTLRRGTRLVGINAATTPGARLRYPLGSTTTGTPVGDRTVEGKAYTVGT